jgi:ankyrin repeat protein
MSPDAFLSALRSGDVVLVHDELSACPELASARDGDGRSAIVLALSHGHREAAELVARARPADACDAAALGDVARLREVIAASPSAVHEADPTGFTPLHFAAYFGARDAAAMLLEAGAGARAVAANASRVQPLHSAAAGRHAPIVALLLARGAEADAPQAGGFTALHAAAQNGDPESVRLLLRAGADPARRADDGRDAREMGRTGRKPELVMPLLGG